MQFQFKDESWSENQWKGLLESLVESRLLDWKQVTTLILGHMNPSQVGTSLASSDGFKRRYGKGNVMSVVMDWFYSQRGTCHDCGNRLELQADHDTPRESFQDPLDADYIENMVLRCRRCNVIKRPSHEFGGQTHLTAEAALMWILFSFRPRTLSDFTKMCRLYGMTMADIRMQEGWAMAHWLQLASDIEYELDTDNHMCQILQWPDGGVTRAWSSDDVPDREKAQVLFETSPNQHIVLLAVETGSTGVSRVRSFRYRVGSLPFSHYFPDVGPEALAVTYTAPKRNGAANGGEQGETANDQGVEESIVEGGESEVTTARTSVNSAKIGLLEPRGLTILNAVIVPEDQQVSIVWTNGRGRKKAEVLLPSSRGRKLCDVAVGVDIPTFTIALD